MRGQTVIYVEEKFAYSTVGSDGERDTATGVRAVDKPSLSRERRERDSDADRRD